MSRPTFHLSGTAHVNLTILAQKLGHERLEDALRESLADKAKAIGDHELAAAFRNQTTCISCIMEPEPAKIDDPVIAGTQIAPEQHVDQSPAPTPPVVEPQPEPSAPQVEAEQATETTTEPDQDVVPSPSESVPDGI